MQKQPPPLDFISVELSVHQVQAQTGAPRR